MGVLLVCKRACKDVVKKRGCAYRPEACAEACWWPEVARSQLGSRLEASVR